jgi:KAP family P-loop domain
MMMLAQLLSGVAMTNAKEPAAAVLCGLREGGHDAPVRQRTDDALERWPLAQAIYRVIVQTPLEWSTRIGLYGSWGTGKTSVLNFLQEIVEGGSDIVVRYSAWSASGEGGAITQFYYELGEELSRRKIEMPAAQTAKRIARRAANFGKLAKNAASELPIPGIGAILEGLSGGAEGWLGVDEADIRALREKLGNRRVVVFVDDLDRADPKVIPKTLLAMRELLDWQGFAFVLAFDKEMVASALGDYSKAFGESANRFLEKIIDVPFDVPPPSAAARQRLARQALQACCNFIPSEALEQSIHCFPGNPRQVKLIARTFGTLGEVVNRHRPGELNLHAMLLQTVLRQISPKVARRVEFEFLKDLADRMSDAQMAEIFLKAGEDATPTDQPFLQELGRALTTARKRDSPERIVYEMDLYYRSPRFTRREFERWFNLWTRSDQRRDAELMVALGDAVIEIPPNRKQSDREPDSENSGVEQEQSQPEEVVAAESVTDLDEAASELFMHALRDYSGWVKSVQTRPTIQRRNTSLSRAALSMRLLRYLWVDCQVNAIVRVRESHGAIEGLINVVDRHASLFDPSLQQVLVEERGLLVDVLKKSGTRLLGLLSGFFSASGQPRPALPHVKHVFVISAKKMGALFARRGGLPPLLSTPSGRWLLVSPQSPLYGTPDLIREFAEAISSPSSHANQEDLALNAIEYLDHLVSDAVPFQTLRDWPKDFSSIVTAAWRAAVRQPGINMQVLKLLSVRDKLVSFGMDAEDLEEVQD